MKQTKTPAKVSGEQPDGTNSKKSNGNGMNPGGQNASKLQNKDKKKPKASSNLEINDSGLVVSKTKNGVDPDLKHQPGSVDGKSGAGGHLKDSKNKR